MTIRRTKTMANSGLDDEKKNNSPRDEQLDELEITPIEVEIE